MKEKYTATWRKSAICKPGLYVLWSKDRKRAYVGESIDIPHRMIAYRLCFLLGDCTFEVVQTFPVGVSKQVRWEAERKYIAKLKRAGVSVVNQEGWHEHMLSRK